MKQVGTTQELPGTAGAFTTAVFQGVPAGTAVFIAEGDEAAIQEDAELFRLFVDAMLYDPLIFIRLMHVKGHQPKTLEEIRVALRDYKEHKDANKQDRQAI